ncbi:LamG domain-containing protein [Metabacillus fastidiosus]|uniref:LamG domain-containing protein n=1 Tax=Metabacillus fastidiosus TaxID=1458 RepID=UPI002E23B279|nr:LamG domain-containing protein [Metabacillus fastidiosus]
MVLHLTFDGTTNDSSGYGNNGTVINAVNISYDENEKVGEKAIKFNGTSQRGSVRIPASPSLSFTNEMSVSYWVRLDNHYGQLGDSPWYGSEGIHGIFVKGQEGNISNYIYTGSGRSDLGLSGGGISVDNPFAIDKWVHVAFTISGTHRKGYIDGELITTQEKTSHNFASSNGSGIDIGWLNSDWYPLNGALDDFRMYNKALSDMEVKALFDLGENN